MHTNTLTPTSDAHLLQETDGADELSEHVTGLGQQLRRVTEALIVPEAEAKGKTQRQSNSGSGVDIAETAAEEAED